jgi:hypothetical protein
VSPEQRKAMYLRNLGRANTVRIARSQVKRELRTDKLSLAEAMGLDVCQGMLVVKLMGARRFWGPGTASKLMAAEGLPESTLVSELAGDEKERLAVAPRPPCCTPPAVPVVGKVPPRSRPARRLGQRIGKCLECDALLKCSTVEGLCGLCLEERGVEIPVAPPLTAMREQRPRQPPTRKRTRTLVRDGNFMVGSSRRGIGRLRRALRDLEAREVREAVENQARLKREALQRLGVPA